MTVVIVLLSLLVTVLLTSRLQKIISGPILKLLSVANVIRNEKDYSVRAQPEGYLEIKQLCGGFNSMLSEIQSRDEHLQHLATYDLLTSLPDRKYFIDILNQAILRGTRKSQCQAISRTVLLLSQSLLHSPRKTCRRCCCVVPIVIFLRNRMSPFVKQINGHR